MTNSLEFTMDVLLFKIDEHVIFLLLIPDMIQLCYREVHWAVVRFKTELISVKFISD